MRFFVYEYTCASPDYLALPTSLRAEGLAMLHALLEDFSQIKEAQTITMVGPDFPVPLPAECYINKEEKVTFQHLAASADYTLVIAPEFDELLEKRCRWIEEAGGVSLNAFLEAIRLTSDKLTVATHFAQHEIPSPKTHSEFIADFNYPIVCKPRFGAGSQETYLLSTAKEKSKGSFKGLEKIYQEYIPGLATSVSFLVNQNTQIPLLPAQQHLSDDGCFTYLGGSIPIEKTLSPRAISLADRAISTVPGLRGFVGVDLLLGETGDHVIEINPRLTTSYIGLRKLSQNNLAEEMLRLLKGENVKISWKDELITFSPDGTFR